MNKKILKWVSLSVLSFAAVLPFSVSAADAVTSIGNVKTAFVGIGAALVVIGWIYAGILYLTAAGKPEKMNVAKGAVIACVIGTLLVILAATACQFINGLFSLGGTC